MRPYDQDPFSPANTAAPAVFGTEADVQDADQPETVVYLPSIQAATPGEDVSFQLHRSDADELLLPAFTSVEALVNAFGESQPWVGVAGDRVEPIREACGAAHVVWDPAPTEA